MVSEQMVSLIIPTTLFIVTGLVIISAFYFKAKEKQLLIEKGLDPDSIKAIYKSKVRDQYWMIKLGIILIFFGAGIGLGLALERAWGEDFYIPLMIFIFTGAGLILANVVSILLNKNKSVKE